MERGAWTAGDEPVLGIVEEPVEGEEADLEALESALTGTGASSVSGSAGAVLDAEPDVLVAIGEAALVSAARVAVDVPILPIGPIRGIGAVSPENGADALSTLLSTGATECRRPLLAVETDGGRRERALFDVTLVTDEPATISEYSVRTSDGRISQFRADGVVVATPAGSHGYASAAGGPQLSGNVDALAVVPVAPFVMQTRHWVLPDGRLSVAVERDECDVTVYADDRAVAGLENGSAVSIGTAGTVSTLVVADSTRVFA